MKNTRSRSVVLTLLSLAFLCGIGLFVYRFARSANLWALSPINKHFAGVNLLAGGDILDRNGVVLAHSKDGKRVYHKDEATRKAVLHTVGDDAAHIATSVQNLYRDELCGYSIVFGAGAPDFFKQSKNIRVTIDSELCKAALTALGDRKGSVCVYNYKTGEILCMVSTPTFDPYHPDVVSADKTGQYEGAYINRVVSASYAPGSVFKLVTSAAGLTFLDGIEHKTYSCHQVETVSGKKITCMGTHGEIGLKDAMMRSCNIYFANLAIDLGKSSMTKTANAMGFNRSFSFDRVETKKSVYDVHDADSCNLGWSGVGQHTDLLNPMHSVILMGAIANSGNAVLPHIISDIFYSDANRSDSSWVFEKSTATEPLLSEPVASKLKEMMRYNVTANYGDSMFPGLNVCAKTGTAEVGDGKEPHGWMVGFAADEMRPLAFSVIVENAGYGSKTAGPIAARVMNLAAKRIFK